MSHSRQRGIKRTASKSVSSLEATVASNTGNDSSYKINEESFDKLDSDDESFDIKKKDLDEPLGKKKIGQKLLLLLQKEKVDLLEKRSENIRSIIQQNFKYGRSVALFIKNWVKNKRKAVKSENSSQPAFNSVDPVLRKLFTSHGFAKSMHIDTLTMLLDQSIPSKLRQYYYDIELEVLKKMVEQKQSLGATQKVILDLPISVQIQGLLMITKDAKSIEKRQNLFDNILLETLRNDINYTYLEQDQIKQIYSLVKDLDLSKTDSQLALKLIKLLNQGEIRDYDMIRTNFQSFDDQFWGQVMTTLNVPGNLRGQYIFHKNTLFSNAIKDYFDENLVNQDFACQLSKFGLLTSEQIQQLSEHQKEQNFKTVLDHVKEKITFEEYLSKIKPYVIFQQALSSSILKVIEKNRVHKWGNYLSLLQSSLTEEGDSIVVVQEAIKNSLSALPGVKNPTKQVIESYYSKLDKEHAKLLFKFPSLMQLEWQRYLIAAIYHLSLTLGKKAIQVKLPTGHGKSIIIQLLAQMFQQKVLIVCMNSFLTFWARQLYYVIENKNIQYVSLEDFLATKPNTDTLVILDEVDIMNGCNSLYLNKGFKSSQACYFHSLLKCYKSWIGFSATISACGRELTSVNFQDSCFINIKTVSDNKQSNTLNSHKVYKDEKDKFQRIKDVMTSNKEVFKNFVVILEDKEECERYFNQLATIHGQKNFLINDFGKYKEAMGKIKQLMDVNFVVVTSKEGGIGVDFKGTDVAHVIIAFKYSSYSELKQALGRGSRDHSKTCSGSLISDQELPCKIEDLINLEKQDDMRKANNLLVADKVAKHLHNRVLDENEVGVIQMFRMRMMRGLCFSKDGDDIANEGLETFYLMKETFDKEDKVFCSPTDIRDAEDLMQTD